MPTGYIATRSSRGMVSWRRTRVLLEGAGRYWIATTDADGRPHLVQQWGAWLDDCLYFEGSPKTRWARNLARDARLAVSVERGTEIVILEGIAEAIARPERALAERISRTYGTKYGRTYRYRPKPDQWDENGLYVLRPAKAFAWDVKTFSRSPTRFVFSRT